MILVSWKYVLPVTGVIDNDGERRPITETISHRCSMLAEESEVQTARRREYDVSPSPADMHESMPCPRAVIRVHDIQSIEVEYLEKSIIGERVDSWVWADTVLK